MQFLQVFSDHPVMFFSFVFILGLLVGSFLNVLILRLPRMMKNQWRVECDQLNNIESAPAEPFNLFTPASHCPSCQHKITALENIPVLSYLFLRGKCSACKTSIPVRYPVIEFLTGVMALILAMHYGPSLQMLAALFLTFSLIGLTFIDIDEQLLPDSLTLPLMWLGIVLALFGIFTDLESSIIGAIAGYLSLWSIFWLFKLTTGKEGMGYGDFKLLAVFGAWLGWQYILLIVLLSSVVGAVLGISMILILGKDKNIPIPFGPYLAIAGWIVLLYGNELNQTYLRIAGIQ